VERVVGKIDIWAPKFLFLNQPLTESEFVNLDPDFVTKVSDIGSGSFHSSQIFSDEFSLVFYSIFR
jgi:hypothetical protein